MNARAVPCAVRAINRNIASGWRQPAGGDTRANRACLSHTRSNSQNALDKFRAVNPLAQCVVAFPSVVEFAFSSNEFHLPGSNLSGNVNQDLELTINPIGMLKVLIRPARQRKENHHEETSNAFEHSAAHIGARTVASQFAQDISRYQPLTKSAPS
jgi:hypothetical protein